MVCSVWIPGCTVTEPDNSVDSETGFLSNDDENIVNAIAMAIAQMDMSIHESGQSVDLAMEAFTETNRCLEKVRVVLKTTQDQNVSDASENLDLATQQLQKAVFALQFFDRLTQRISHVKENLSSVSTLIQEPTTVHPYLWGQLQEKMKTVYSQDQERKLYQSMSERTKGKVTQDDIISNHESTYGGTELF